MYKRIATLSIPSLNQIGHGGLAGTGTRSTLSAPCAAETKRWLRGLRGSAFMMLRGPTEFAEEAVLGRILKRGCPQTTVAGVSGQRLPLMLREMPGSIIQRLILDINLDKTTKAPVNPVLLFTILRLHAAIITYTIGVNFILA